MSEQSFKERVRLEMISMAKLYKDKYVDYEYLICSEGFVQNGYYIVDAEEDNFQHLTGVHSLISPKEFFEKCYNGILQESDFDFTKEGQNEKAVKGTVRRKMNAFPAMMALFDNDIEAEEDFQKNKVVCSFAAADGSCTLGFSESEKVRPKSFIKGNALNNPSQVDLILRKKSEKELFDEIVLGDSDALERHREKIERLLSEELSVKEMKG